MGRRESRCQSGTHVRPRPLHVTLCVFHQSNLEIPKATVPQPSLPLCPTCPSDVIGCPRHCMFPWPYPLRVVKSPYMVLIREGKKAKCVGSTFLMKKGGDGSLGGEEVPSRTDVGIPQGIGSEEPCPCEAEANSPSPRRLPVPCVPATRLNNSFQGDVDACQVH